MAHWGRWHLLCSSRHICEQIAFPLHWHHDFSSLFIDWDAWGILSRIKANFHNKRHHSFKTSPILSQATPSLGRLLFFFLITWLQIWLLCRFYNSLVWCEKELYWCLERKFKLPSLPQMQHPFVQSTAIGKAFPSFGVQSFYWDSIMSARFSNNWIGGQLIQFFFLVIWSILDGSKS